MKDMHVMAIMAAIIWGHIDCDMPIDEAMKFAAERANELLGEVSEYFAKESEG